MDELADHLSDIKRVAIDPDEIGKFTSEQQFMKLAVDLMVETGSYVCVAACTLGKKTVWNRDQAAIGGNMVRLFKLLHSVLDQTCQRREETSFILGRLVFETVVNIRYLVLEYSPELVASYIEHSFRHEAKLLALIRANIAARGGDVLPIEDRMLKSIHRSAAAAGIDVDKFKPQKGPWGGKNLFEKAAAVGCEDAYLAAFGGASHSVHGNWHEIYGKHLHWDKNGGFTPNTDWHVPRPQTLNALCVLVINTLPVYFSFMAGDAAAAAVEQPLNDLLARVFQAAQLHEGYLSRKTWPQI